MNTVFIGTAGSGKSSLTATFGKWLEKETKSEVAYVNLDPGCHSTPYEPDFDVRELFTVNGLMREEGLGPSGAMVRAADLMEERASEVVGGIAEIGGDVKLVDTPGQTEIFLFRPAGPRIVGALKERDRTVAAYVIDPILASTATGLTVALSLSIVAQLRLGVPTVPVMNKSDLLESGEVVRLLTDRERLKSKVEEEGGVLADLASEYLGAMRKVSKTIRLVKVSAKMGSGMGDLYDAVRETVCACGDLT